MGRIHQDRETREKTKVKSPQVPEKDIVQNDDQYEIAKELDDRYEMEVKPGFEPTGVRRKNKE
jgi:hypothetical protein